MKDISEIEIILIEDSRADAALTRKAFEKMGLENNLTVLQDGAEALGYLIHSEEINGKKFKKDSKLILLDLLLPKIHGVEVLRTLKSNSETKHLPIVVLTASYEDPIKYTCKELGADGFITKPVTPDAFLKAIEDLSNYWTDNK